MIQFLNNSVNVFLISFVSWFCGVQIQEEPGRGSAILGAVVICVCCSLAVVALWAALWLAWSLGLVM